MSWFWRSRTDESGIDSDYDDQEDYEDEDNYSESSSVDDEHDCMDNAASNENDQNSFSRKQETELEDDKIEQAQCDSIDTDSFHYPQPKDDVQGANDSLLGPAADRYYPHPKPVKKDVKDALALSSHTASQEESTIPDDDASFSGEDVSSHDSSSKTSTDAEPDEDVAAGRIPGAVAVLASNSLPCGDAVCAQGRNERQAPQPRHAILRERLDSAVSSLNDEEEAGDVEEADMKDNLFVNDIPKCIEDGEGQEDGSDDGIDQATLAEKRSLLLLAAEHDRVDIIQAILGACDSSTINELLNPTMQIPPIHVSASHGSLNATNCLLRMGADPGIRPTLRQHQDVSADSSNNKKFLKFNRLSAWEIVFGVEKEQYNVTTMRAAGASDSPSLSGSASQSRQSRSRSQPLVDLAPSKKEGIRHAFTAEALRCIGSDESHRLQQLLEAGMPPAIDMGGKSLYDWSVTMDAAKCEKLLLSFLKDDNGGHDGILSGSVVNVEQGVATSNGDSETPMHHPRILDREEEEGSIAQLANRLDELDSLSKALSVSLDSLAEEVSVCNGLLLMGGGASALAIHVRSLKDTKQRKIEELARLEEAWENSRDELAYWVQQGGFDAQKIAETMLVPRDSLHRKSSLVSVEEGEKELERNQMMAQIAAADHKVYKLRASITDLSEALTREIAEVERRGLSGGINMVRGLREEIREIEFALSEVTNEEATCRTKISLIQSMMNGLTKGNNTSTESTAILSGESIVAEKNPDLNSSPTLPCHFNATSDLAESEAIATGHSTALTVRNEGGQGLFPFSLWEIIKRIIGLVDDQRRATQQVMLV